MFSSGSGAEKPESNWIGKDFVSWHEWQDVHGGDEEERHDDASLLEPSAYVLVISSKGTRSWY
eukprot:CAMPEP_0197243108 /NCGR_PEP_ID=MMETSP1429-20130617/8656_1 /TAXON_ID=49237 /ORGANISM="Chaetoceros  sp., Strain UNC1202" /LENGTH=62 /DNA_ID=CAMNT_0042703259 /DNA_START=599 /DNA_END=787 /DNA_ORIENTATION=-